jgi:hypothetical protein
MPAAVNKSQHRRRGSWFENLLSRLVNPKDTRTAWTFACLLLMGETLLLALIIKNVSCKSSIFVSDPPLDHLADRSYLFDQLFELFFRYRN